MLSRQSVIQISEWPQNRVMSVHFGGTFVTGHRLCSIKAGYFILMFVYRSTITWDVYIRNNCGKNECHKILRCDVSCNCTKINNGELTFGVELTQPLWQMWRLIYLLSGKQRTVPYVCRMFYFNISPELERTLCKRNVIVFLSACIFLLYTPEVC